MARAASNDVQAILGSHYGSLSLTAFITTATALVDWLDSKDAAGDLTDTLLTQIETYLAAHFYAHADQIATSKSTGGASASFQGQTAMVLSSTQYGQTAMLLDVTGKLAQRSKEAEQGTRMRVGMSWLGKSPSNQTDYEDRD